MQKSHTKEHLFEEVVESLWPDQIVPLFLTTVVFLVLSLLYYLIIEALNVFVGKQQIDLQIHSASVLLGMAIYLKTAVDFAIYIGNLMRKFPGWRNRIKIEIGTALGNAVGTALVLIIWDIFREVPLLMAIMILYASIVLFYLAEDGFEHAKKQAKSKRFKNLALMFEKALERLNRILLPLTKFLHSHEEESEPKVDKRKSTNLWKLSFIIPFVLGADDFAGYIPLFTTFNVLSFGIGVFLGHMLLNIFLFLSPKKTVKVVSNPVVSFIGGLVFIFLALWGIKEAGILLFEVIKSLG